MQRVRWPETDVLTVKHKVSHCEEAAGNDPFAMFGSKIPPTRPEIANLPLNNPALPCGLTVPESPRMLAAPALPRRVYERHQHFLRKTKSYISQ